MRLNKFLSTSGICSRRKADELIINGEISVNDKIINELGFKISRDDIVKYKGNLVKLNNNLEYILINKPIGYTSTVKDRFAEKTVIDLIKNNNRIYPVGRLDKDSRGLLLLTNDGDLTYKLTHPSNNIEKTYIVKVNKPPSDDELKLLRKGVVIEEKKTKEAFIERIDSNSFIIKISEGRNRQIRKMFESINYKVIDLKRIAIGNIQLGNLKEGSFRKLSNSEINYLRSL